MKVICKGFKNCKYNDRCHHAKEHEFDIDIKKNNNSCSGYQDRIDHDCFCDQKYLRLKKLDELKNK